MIMDNFYCLICRSINKPVTVVRELMNQNIVVDAVLVGRAENTVLRGISYVTGLCVNIFLFSTHYFKPQN